jgi:dTDP-glucose 4,6-dehydratase
MNVFGERQHKEKFIPLVIGKILRGEVVAIHANANKTKAGSRCYIHARNVANAVQFIIEHGVAGEKYNIVGTKEVDNLTLAQTIAEIMDAKLHYELVDFHSSRPGHDLRYALDGKKMAAMGWQPPVDFEVALERVVKWTLRNKQWL